jgi:hypothetical protein
LVMLVIFLYKVGGGGVTNIREPPRQNPNLHIFYGWRVGEAIMTVIRNSRFLQFIGSGFCSEL